MTDFENKDLQPETAAPETTEPAQVPAEEPSVSEPVQEAPVQAEPQPAAETASARPTPHLTLEPDPVVPEIPVPEGTNIPGSAAEPFHMPDSPHAPNPPQSEPVQQQQTPPNYTAQQPQYSAPPQYNAPPQYSTSNYTQPVRQTYYNVPPAGYTQKSRLAAGLLAIMLGVFGVHNFYLGYNTRAIIQLVITLFTCGIGAVVSVIWSFVEGVLILTANNPTRMYDGNGVILKD